MRRLKWILIDLLIPHGHPQVSASCVNFQRIRKSFQNFANLLVEPTERRKKKNGRGQREKFLLSKSDDCCRFSPSKKQERNQLSPLSFLLPRPFLSVPLTYILSRSPPHHDHPQAVLFSHSPLSRNLFHPFALFLLVPRGLSIDEFRRGEEQPEQGQTEEYVFGEGQGVQKARGDERPQKESQREIDKRERKVYDTAEGVERRRTRERSDGDGGGGGGGPASRCALNPGRYRAKRPNHPPNPTTAPVSLCSAYPRM